MTALISSPALAASFGSRLLQLGMHGGDVRTLQQDLTLTGIATQVTGQFNRTTRGHVLSFQRRHRLTADGVVGPMTAHAIRTAVARARATDPGAGTNGAGTGTTTTSTSSTPTATTASSGPNSGGTALGAPSASSPEQNATLGSDGLAVAPSGAPAVVREVIAAANNIAFKPYVYGGGHQSFTSSGYDCSGSVSYALHGGGLLSTPMDSTQFETWGQPGPGTWMTIWADSGHAFMEVAGLYFDTAAMSSRNQDRWSTTRVSPNTGFTVVHPKGW